MTIRIISRAELGLPPTTAMPIPGPTAELILHHTATTGWHGADGVRACRAFHMSLRGMQDIAYNFLVDHDGTIYEGRGPLRFGAHTLGHNETGQAICVMGNHEVEFVPDPVIFSLASLVQHGHRQGWWPDRLTHGHRDLVSTSCPGSYLYPLIASINSLALLEEDDVTPDDITAIADAVVKHLAVGTDDYTARVYERVENAAKRGVVGDLATKDGSWIRRVFTRVGKSAKAGTAAGPGLS